MRFWGSSIRGRIEAAIMVTCMVVLAATYVVLMTYEWFSSEREVASSIETEARIIADNSTAAVAFRSPEDAAQVLNSASADQRVRAAAIYLAEGEQFVSYRHPDWEGTLPDRSPTTGSFKRGGELYVSRTIEEGGEQLGMLLIVASFSDRWAKLIYFALFLVLIFGMGLMIATAFSGILKRRIAEPVTSLTSAVDRIARDKDYSVRAPTEGEGEIAELGRSFNEMIEEIQIRDHALLAREQEFRALVELSPDIIVRYDRDFRIHYVSPAVESVIGRSPSFYLGKRIADLSLVAGSQERWISTLERVVETRKPALLEMDVTNARGEPLSLHARIVPELGRNGEVVTLLAISRDITERRKVEEVLRQAKENAEAAARTKSIFLANMSHDIRTPLTSIIGFAEILGERVTGEDRELSDMIREGGRRLMDTLNSVLDLARLEGSSGHLKRKRVDLASVLPKICNLLAPSASGKGLELIADVRRGPVFLWLDESALSRITINLLGNAIKFTQKGNVTLSLVEEEDDVLIQVADTGPGIPDEFRSQLFDAFTRSKGSQAEGVEGSGLGLTITRQLVELLGGTISVETEVNKGSTFTVRFPRNAPPDEPDEIAPASADGAQQKKSILVVEDNANTRALLRHRLAKDYEVKMAVSCKEALEVTRGAEGFDLVLLDIALETREAGLDCLKQMRKMHRYKETPIIAFTAHAVPEDADRFESMGFDALLEKPFSSRRLYEVLGRFI